MTPKINPTNGEGTRKVKLFIATVYLITPLVLMTYRLSVGESPDTAIFIIVVMLMFASAYVVFGEKVVDKATEQAKDTTGDSSSDEGDEN